MSGAWTVNSIAFVCGGEPNKKPMSTMFSFDRASTRASWASFSVGVMWQYGDERPVSSTHMMSVLYGVVVHSATAERYSGKIYIARKKVAKVR